MFGNSSKQKVIQAPFESAELNQNYYDIVLSSPPYFDLEIYDISNNSSQSIESYPSFDKWMVRFLFVSLKKAWDALKMGGYLVLHLGDTRSLNMCEATNIFIGSLNNSEWLGTVGVYGGSFNNKRPVWIWKKSHNETKWKEDLTIDYPFYNDKKPTLSINERKLANTYINISKELFNYNLEKIYGEGLYMIVENINQIKAMLYPINVSSFFLYNLNFDAKFYTYWIAILRKSIPHSGSVPEFFRFHFYSQLRAAPPPHNLPWKRWC